VCSYCRCTNCSSPGKKNNDDPKKFVPNIIRRIIEAITIAENSRWPTSNTLNTQSEAPFVPFKGAGNQVDHYKELGFEMTFSDTTRRTGAFIFDDDVSRCGWF